MKNKFLLMLIASSVMLPAFADMPITDLGDTDKIINSGYSRNMGELIELQKNKAMRVPYTKPAEPEYYNYPPVKFVREVFKYIDPALDDGDFGLHESTPNVKFNDAL